MKKIFRLIFIVLLLVFSVSAQAENEPKLIDEFGKLNAEENFARLDFLAVALSKVADSKAVIRISGGGENCFLCHYEQGSYTTAILKSRKYQLNQFSIEYCQGSADLRVQFYVMPPNATLPPCDQTLIVPKQSILYETTYFFSVKRVTPLENAYVESVSPAEGEYSLGAFSRIKAILANDPQSRIYIIGYPGPNPLENLSAGKTKRISNKRSLIREIMLRAKNEFVKRGLKPSQIKTLEGGNVALESKLEFWFVPTGGAVPKPKPDYIPKKKRK